MTDTKSNYSLFNFSIKSDIKFIGIPTTKKKPDIIIEEDDTLIRRTNDLSVQELSIHKGWIENKELIAQIKPKIIKYKFLSNLDDHVKQTKLLHQTLPSILFQNNCDNSNSYDILDNEVFDSNWDGNVGYYGGDSNFNDGDY